MSAVLVAFGVVFLAELGDKSQLLAMAFAARYRLPVVLAGVVGAAAVIQALSVAVGTAARAAVPAEQLAIVAGVAFLAFAAWTLWDAWRGGDDEVADGVRNGVAGEEGQRSAGRSGRAQAVTVAGAFILAELGDKTMVATMALAAQYGPLVTWAGATAGMATASGLGAVVGSWLGERLPQRPVQVAAGVVFAATGVWILWQRFGG